MRLDHTTTTLRLTIHHTPVSSYFVGIRLPCTLLAIIAALGCCAASAQAQQTAKRRGPTDPQISQAITRAEQSSKLWATINVCQTRGRNAAKGGSIGVRGQMPTLGFAATLRMTIQLNRYSGKSETFVALPFATAKTTVSPGTFAVNLHQAGAVFPFSGPAGLLNAIVTLSWTRSGRLLGGVAVPTTAGHRDAARGRPAHYSAAQCQLG